MPAPLTAAVGELRALASAAGGAVSATFSAGGGGSSRRGTLLGQGTLLGGGMAAAAALSLALVAPHHAAAPSTVQGDGTDWHLGWYAALCVLFGRGLALGWRACNRCDETAVVEGPPMRRLLAVAAVYALVLPVLGLQVLLPLP